jgi:hypothetical protein
MQLHAAVRTSSLSSGLSSMRVGFLRSIRRALKILSATATEVQRVLVFPEIQSDSYARRSLQLPLPGSSAQP